jgi:dihydrofolate reductase
MRIVTYGAACSLDGFIAASDGALDWLHFSRDVEKTTSRYWSTIDTVLMGRKTWEVSAGQNAGTEGTGSDGSSAGNGASPIKTYIFSRTLRDAPAGAEIVSSDAGRFVKELKRQPGSGICVMGGGELAGSLFEAGVIDEVGLNIHPILLGSGVPLFRDPKRRVELELKESRTIDGGCVLSTYRVRG